MKRQKEKKFVIPCVLVFCTAVMVLSACNGGMPGLDPDGDPGAGTDITTVLSLNTSNCDFGIIEAEAGSSCLPVEITNKGASQVTLTAAHVSDRINFSSDDSVLPVTLEPGENVSIECTFHPMESGSFLASLHIEADGYDDPLETVLNGNGNYPPAIAPGMMVSDIDPEIAGFYCPDREHNGKTLYRNLDNSHYKLFFHESSGRWVLGVDETIADYSDGERYQSSTKFIYDSPAFVPGWSYQYRDIATDVEDNVTGPVISGADFSKIRTKPATVLKAYYYFCDADEDTENGSQFTWYRCTEPDDTGVEIAGASGRDYVVTSDDLGCYLRVEMVPCADSGIQDGELISGPTSPQLLYSLD